MQKVLFTSALGPYAEQYFNTSPTDVFNQRFSRGCGIFTLHGHLHMNALHVIAQNISVPSTVLEYPSEDDFVAELGKGYDFLGISSFHNQVDNVVSMCLLARQHAPKLKIVLGGYGAVGIEACFDPERVRELCDHLCHEEGIAFFRGLLGEDPAAPMSQSHLPRWGYGLPWLDPNPPGQTPVMVASVGCPNGCDFCGTTEMFCKTRHQLLTPDQVHGEFQRAWRANPYCHQATFLEEDSYQNVEYMREVGRLLREDSEFGLSHYNFYCLSSNRSLSKWDLDDVMLTGVSTIFIGVESKFAPDEGYGKRGGLSIQEMFKALHRRGIMTTGAWMVGFDFQNPQNIEEDFAEFLSCEPTMHQIARVCPFPATPMWEQMRGQGRIRDDVTWEEISFYGGGGMAPANFTEEQIMGKIEEGYRRLYETWGASIARILKVNLLGYEYCTVENRDGFWRDRAEYHKRMAVMMMPLLKPMRIYAPNNTVRKRMKDLERTYGRLIGEPTSFQTVMAQGLTAMAGFQRFSEVLYPRDNIISEEPFKRYEYHKNGGAKPYDVSWPHRRKRYRLERAARSGLTHFLHAAGRLSDRYDQLRGVDFDPAMKRGNPSRFLAPG